MNFVNIVKWDGMWGNLDRVDITSVYHMIGYINFPQLFWNRSLCSRMMWFRSGWAFVGRSKDGCWEPSAVVGMACGNSSSKVSLLQALAAVSNFSWIPGFVLQYAVTLPKSMVILCFIRKSQPKMTGVDRLSSTMKVCSTWGFPRLTDIRDVPQGKMHLRASSRDGGYSLLNGSEYPSHVSLVPAIFGIVSSASTPITFNLEDSFCTDVRCDLACHNWNIGWVSGWAAEFGVLWAALTSSVLTSAVGHHLCWRWSGIG